MSSTARRDRTSTCTRSSASARRILLLTGLLFADTFIFLLTRNATLSAGITIVPSLFATGNISHHCWTNICFSTAAGTSHPQFPAHDCRWSIRWSTETAIGKLPPCTCNWDSEIILDTFGVLARGAVKILFIIIAIDRGGKREERFANTYFTGILFLLLNYFVIELFFLITKLLLNISSTLV